ncbi:MAG: CHAD domain-containing protein [Candidatus Eremiobacteraeota bacterium]|nr:CHAD domain-containing protein [Candidatus Eremiobacteraeota bacterium]
MKPQRVDLGGVSSVEEVIERVLEARLAEVRTLTRGLHDRDKRGLHDFRIACKRLRYALERFEALNPSLEAVADRLAMLQDALGEAHDRDVLLAILPPAMAATERRLQSEREACIDRAFSLWKEVEELIEAVDSHAI